MIASSDIPCNGGERWSEDLPLFRSTDFLAAAAPHPHRLLLDLSTSVLVIAILSEPMLILVQLFGSAVVGVVVYQSRTTSTHYSSFEAQWDAAVTSTQEQRSCLYPELSLGPRGICTGTACAQFSSRLVSTRVRPRVCAPASLPAACSHF